MAATDLTWTAARPNARATDGGQRIVFAMTPEWGSYLPALPLATELAGRGFEVGFLGPPEGWPEEAVDGLRGLVESRGFGFVHAPAVPMPSRPAQYLKGPRLVDRALADLAERLDGPGGAALVVGDSLSPLASAVPMAAAMRGIPFARLETNLLSSANRRLPPFTSSRAPGRSGRYPAAAAVLAWLARALQLGVRNLYLKEARLFAAVRLLLAAKSWTLGLGGGGLDSFTEYGWRLRTGPAFVLCPETFELPGAARRIYLGGCVDERRPATDEAAVPAGDAPLFYCSLGTHSRQYPDSGRFFRVLLEAFRRRPQYRAVVHVGDACAPDDLRPIPEGVHVVRWTSQPDVLMKARVAVTHGGLGTIKECVRYQVPMLVFPMAFDQPGNSVRVVWHGLGERGDSRWIGADELAVRLDGMLDRGERFRDGLRAVHAAFTSPEPLRAGADALARMARPGRAREGRC